MAKVYVERAYIEPYDEENESHQILIHIKDNNDHILAGVVQLTKNINWLYTQSSENGDLEVLYSPEIETRIMDYLVEEIIGG